VIEPSPSSSPIDGRSTNDFCVEQENENVTKCIISSLTLPNLYIVSVMLLTQPSLHSVNNVNSIVTLQHIEDYEKGRKEGDDVIR